MATQRKVTVFVKTPIGQLFYDLAFTWLSPKYLAQKHKLPIAEIRQLREVARKPRGKNWPPRVTR